MRINQNISAMNAYRQLVGNQGGISKSLEKLSSGLRINRASDDAAGLAISEKMRGQVRGLKQASRNAQDGISMIQTAEGALQEVHSILQRMRELSVQSATDSNTADDRAKLQSEVDQLAKEITRISNTTEFNTKNLLAGGLSSTFHIGANANQKIDMTVAAMDARALGVAGNLVTTSMTNQSNIGIASISTQSESLNGLFINARRTNADDATALEGKDVLNNVAGAVTWTGSNYTGSADATYIFRIGSVDGVTGEVLTGNFSTDGGASWTQAAKSGSNFILGNGLQLQIANNVGNLVDGTVTVSAVAQKLTFKLNTTNDGTGTNYGSEVSVGNNASSVTIGDASREVTINFNFATAFAAVAGTTYSAGDSATINQSITQSTSATIGANGSVANEAVTHKGINVSAQSTANLAITTINSALEKVSGERSKLGAMQNRLEHTINNLGTAAENLAAAESRIRDVDMAQEMMQFTKFNILNQAATAMLAQANALPQSVLQLLG